MGYIIKILNKMHPEFQSTKLPSSPEFQSTCLLLINLGNQIIWNYPLYT